MSGSVWRESHPLHCASQAASRPFPRHTRARVEVEHHAVGMFERCRAGVQRVNLDDVPLRRREQALLACHLAMLDVADPWRLGGSRIPEKSERREAFNIMLSMPRGTDPLVVQRAAREFAQAELAGHRYVMVLHDHQANPHVHLSVRAESRQGKRLNPRKADLQRWRETFAERLRGWGIDAEATRQATRGEQRNYPTMWRAKAQARGTLRQATSTTKSGAQFSTSHKQALESWVRIMEALAGSNEPADRKLAGAVRQHITKTPFAIDFLRSLKIARQQELSGMQPARIPTVTRLRPDPEIER